MRQRPTDARAAMARAMTEDELLQAITDAATVYGWRWHHIRRSDKGQQMGHAGFPDLLLARGGQIIALELKTERGSATLEQAAWLQALSSLGTVALVIRPADLDRVLAWLR